MHEEEHDPIMIKSGPLRKSDQGLCIHCTRDCQLGMFGLVYTSVHGILKARFKSQALKTIEEMEGEDHASKGQTLSILSFESYQ